MSYTKPLEMDDGEADDTEGDDTLRVMNFFEG